MSNKKIELPEKWWKREPYANAWWEVYPLDCVSVGTVDRAKIGWIIETLELIVSHLNEND